MFWTLKINCIINFVKIDLNLVWIDLVVVAFKRKVCVKYNY